MKLKIATVINLLLFSFVLFAQQQITVTGTVTEEATGYPAIGVTVLVKGTAIGTVTDMDGNYTLDNVPVNATIVFSYIGMLTVEEPLNGRSTVNVIRSEER